MLCITEYVLIYNSKKYVEINIIEKNTNVKKDYCYIYIKHKKTYNIEYLFFFCLL